MGKKKIKKQTEEEVLKESEGTSGGEKTLAVPVPALSGPSGAKSQSPTVLKGRVYIKVSYNNTFITVTDESGGVLAWSSAGSLGFKGPKKATPYAASKVAEAIFEKVKKINFSEIELFVAGIGSGRESAVRAIAGHGFNVISIKDITPTPHNGPRAKKVRRV